MGRGAARPDGLGGHAAQGFVEGHGLRIERAEAGRVETLVEAAVRLLDGHVFEVVLPAPPVMAMVVLHAAILALAGGLGRNAL